MENRKTRLQNKAHCFEIHNIFTQRNDPNSSINQIIPPLILQQLSKNTNVRCQNIDGLKFTPGPYIDHELSLIIAASNIQAKQTITNKIKNVSIQENKFSKVQLLQAEKYIKNNTNDKDGENSRSDKTFTKQQSDQFLKYPDLMESLNSFIYQPKKQF